jgi:hypothetical protein
MASHILTMARAQYSKYNLSNENMPIKRNANRLNRRRQNPHPKKILLIQAAVGWEVSLTLVASVR